MDMIEIEQTVRPHRLSVVVPMYNEEDSVTPLVTQVHEALADYRHPWELELVNDGSSDNTEQQMRLATELWGSHVRVIDLQRNFEEEQHKNDSSHKDKHTNNNKNVRLYGEMHRFIPAWMAASTSPRRIKEEVVRHHARQYGQSKYGIGRTFRVVLDLLVVYFFMRFRSRPGHFFGRIGLIFGGLGALGLAYLAFIKVFLGHDIGTRPLLLISVLLILMAVQFLTTGVLSEMMARTYYESSQTRSYVVREEAEPPKDVDWKLPE